MTEVGFGESRAKFSVFIANRPALEEYTTLQVMRTLSAGEVGRIAERCGNHWRKIFNCYAKLAFAIDPLCYSRWQDYRDYSLLQSGSALQLRFDGKLMEQRDGVSVICGRTYAKALSLPEDLQWLDSDFAVSKAQRLIVCPYFDYRQLSNVKIQRLSELLQTLIE